MLSKLTGVRIFDVEVSAVCNLRCVFCSREKLPSVGLMSQETYSRFLDHVELGRFDTVAFIGLGEPTLNRELADFVKETRRRHPRARTWVTTNGTRLDPRLVSALLDAGLDTLDVSFNGVDAETYSQTMAGARFEQTVQNVEQTARAIEARSSRTRLQVNHILTAEDALRSEGLRSFWRARGVQHFRLQQLHSRAGLARVQGMTPPDRPGLRRRRCAKFELMPFVTWQGEVLTCSHDLTRRQPIGDLRTESWQQVATRRAAILRSGSWPEICRACDDPLRHHMHQEIDASFREELAGYLKTGGRQLVQAVRATSRIARRRGGGA